MKKMNVAALCCALCPKSQSTFPLSLPTLLDPRRGAGRSSLAF